jgi:hypothetical protein
MRAIWFASVFVLVGCGGDDDAAPGTGDTAVPGSDTGVDSAVVDSAKTDTAVAVDTAVGADTAVPDVADAGSDADASVSDADAGCPSTWTTAPTVDASIALPTGAGGVLLHALGTGTQNYTCKATTAFPDAGGDTADAEDAADSATTTYAWTLTAPEADLTDCHSTKIGTHFASAAGASAPEWMTTDGTFVIGARDASYTASATTIPWLRIKVTSQGGTGILAKTAWILRLETTGGKAPATGCDASSVGATTKIAYTADYWFFGTP